MRPSARIVSGHAPRRAHFGGSRAEPVDQRSADREHARDHEHGRHRRTRPGCRGTGRRRSRRRGTRPGSPAFSGRVGGLHLPAFHRLRPIEPVQVQDRRRDVDHAHEAVLARRRRAQQTPARTRAPVPTTGVSDGRSVGGAGPTTMTASRFGSTSASSRPTRSSVSRSASGPQARRAARRTRSDRPGRHARDRTPRRARRRGRSTTGGTHRAPGRDRDGRRTARRGRLAADRGRPALPAPCPACVISAATALRRYGGTRSSGVLGSLPSPLAITARAMPACASRRRAARPRRRRARCRSRRSRR